MVYLAARVVPGIALGDGPVWPALLAGLVLALVNAVVRPVLRRLTMPLTILTPGLFVFVLNAFCLWLTSVILPGVVVPRFPAALLRALLVSAVGLAPTAFLSHA